ncbi:DUF3139 domain-containing protein [Lysinibacillus sp. NPDC097195]|uniref:DUF3139 domain-containing protein n=1 Tax=Lysinibacillus sp. NPDC097195 TaxID=3364141 RepID=UPI00381BB569
MKKFLLVALLLIVLVPYFTVQLKKIMYEHKIRRYLIEEIHYVEEDIQSVDCEWYLGGLPNYSVNVIFNDEPNVVYIYFVHNKDRLGQFEHFTLDGTVLQPEQLKHYKP